MPNRGRDSGRGERTHTPGNMDENVMQFAPKHLTKQEFGRRLYQLMIAKGWRQSDLARHADLPRDSVSTYIRGKTLPTPISVTKLAEALGVSPDNLMPNHIEGAIDADNPELEIRASPGMKGMAWLRVNRLVSMKTALRVMDILESDNAAHAGGSGAASALLADDNQKASD